MLYGLCKQLDMRPGILSMTLEHLLDKMLVHLKHLSKLCAMNAAEVLHLHGEGQEQQLQNT